MEVDVRGRSIVAGSSSAADHPRRALILSILETRGPTPRSTVMRETGMSRSAFLHHARRLSARGAIYARRIGRRWIYARRVADQRAATESLPSETAQRILEVATAQPRLTQQEIGVHVGATQSYVSRVLQRYRPTERTGSF